MGPQLHITHIAQSACGFLSLYRMALEDDGMVETIDSNPGEHLSAT